MDIDKTLRDVALLVSRVTLGGTMLAHGAQKMFGIQGGPGIEGTAKMMHSLGFRPGERYAPLLAATEVTSGALMSLGAFGPVAPAMLLAVMLVAVETVHRPKGYFNANGGYEMNTMFVLTALLLANEGYGSYSIDEMLGLRAKMRPMHAWMAMLGGIAGALLILSQRTTEEQPQQAPSRPGQGSRTQTTETPIAVASR
jgi:putative oxidoreductase